LIIIDPAGPKCVTMLPYEMLTRDLRSFEIRKWRAESHICCRTINNTHYSTTNFNRSALLLGFILSLI